MKTAALVGAGRRYRLVPVPLFLLLGSISPMTQAGTADLGSGITLDYLANLTYSLAMRVDDADSELTANANGDDANRNFDSGALTNNRLAVLAETNFKYRNYGVFLRGSAFYDDAYRHGNDNDSPATINKAGDHDEFTSEARKLLGADARLLDAYAYGRFTLASTSLDVRAGSQVVSWGESLFFPNMSGAQAPADATKSNVPGTEVKDILMPLGQVYAQWGLTERASLLAYWQYDWNSTELTPVGGYFSTTDIIGPGSQFLIVNLPPLPIPNAPSRVNVRRGPDINPDDSGQWGVAGRYLVGDATELTLYHINYHDKNPAGAQFNNPGILQLLSGQTSYQAVYVDDIRMTAVGLSSQVFGAAVGAEVSLRQDAGIAVNAPGIAGSPGPTVTRGDVWQANLNTTKLLLPTRWYDSLTLLGEVSWLYVENVDAINVTGAGGTTSFDTLSNGREAGAYQLLAQVGYTQVFPGWDMTLSAVHAYQFKGKSPIAGALGSLTGEGDIRYSFGPTFKYLNNLELAMAYNGYAGGASVNNRPLADRSHVSFSAKYSF